MIKVVALTATTLLCQACSAKLNKNYTFLDMVAYLGQQNTLFSVKHVLTELGAQEDKNIVYFQVFNKQYPNYIEYVKPTNSPVFTGVVLTSYDIFPPGTPAASGPWRYNDHVARADITFDFEQSKSCVTLADLDHRLGMHKIAYIEPDSGREEYEWTLSHTHSYLTRLRTTFGVERGSLHDCQKAILIEQIRSDLKPSAFGDFYNAQSP